MVPDAYVLFRIRGFSLQPRKLPKLADVILGQNYVASTRLDTVPVGFFQANGSREIRWESLWITISGENESL